MSGSPVAPLNLQELVTRILGLFSVTSWLPSVLLTGNGVALWAYFAWAHGPDGDVLTPQQIERLGTLPTGVVVAVLLFGVIVATTVMQSIELVAVRVCAGDWPSWRLQALGLAHMRWRHGRLRARQAVLASQIWQSVHPELTRTSLSTQEIERVRQWISGEPVQLSGPEVVVAERTWKSLVPQHLVLRWEDVDDRLRDYPGMPPYAPTLLGTYLRRLADELHALSAGHRVFLEHGHELPDSLRVEYSGARNRLDMHAALALSFGLLAVTAATLAAFSPRSSALVGVALAGLYALFCVASYFAALRMVRNYGNVALAAAAAVRLP